MAFIVLATVGACLLPSAAVRGAQPMTMRALSDASDAPAVLAEAVDAARADDDPPHPAAQPRPAEADSSAPRSDDAPDRFDSKIELETVLDREQESESEIEDRDVPEDIDYDLANVD